MKKRIVIPNPFLFSDRGISNFEKPLSIFNWDFCEEEVVIDISDCFSANYQALSLIVLYIWYLKARGCYIDIVLSKNKDGATKMWNNMGAVGWSQVLYENTQNFRGVDHKPLLAIKNQNDFSAALQRVESYTKNFDIEYEKTLRHIISELLYNTIEHGISYIENINRKQLKIPSVIQFNWYKRKNELHFIIADLGVGIKKHMEQTYPGQESHEDAIIHALQYKVSGTFGINDPYKSKNNAGVGLYLSSNLIKRLHADMHILSGNGLVHISPRDQTKTKLMVNWPGTMVLVKIKIGEGRDINLQRLMSELKESAERELSKGISTEQENIHYLNIENYFGRYAENKQEAINYRDRYLIDAVNCGKILRIDFNNVVSSPHSFLSALLATPIKIIGILAYKKIKIINAQTEIRETIDHILNENT